MTVVFLVVTAAMIIQRSRAEKNWINLISVLMGPYFFVVLLNNFVIYRFGFYKISDEVLIMLTCAFVLFFIGSSFFNLRRQPITLNKEEDTKDKLAQYDINTMTVVLYIIGIIAIIRLFSMYVSGQFSAENIDDAEGIMGTGIVGHLLLVSYSILPIVFLHWTYHVKQIKYLIPILLIAIATFATLVKYNIIGMFVTLFIFIMIYRKSLFRYALIILLIAVVAVFIGNYILTFSIKGANSSFAFYLNHLWTYVSGSVIYDDYIFTNGIRVGVNIGYKLMTFLCAIPNMFLNRIAGVQIFSHESQNFNFISSTGERSNVVDAIGYLYPSQGDVLDIILFGLVIFLLGFLFAIIYRRSLHASNKISTTCAIFLCYFVFFSFFGTFYINPGPWETLIFSLFVPNLFYRRRVNIVWRK